MGQISKKMLGNSFVCVCVCLCVTVCVCMWSLSLALLCWFVSVFFFSFNALSRTNKHMSPHTRAHTHAGVNPICKTLRGARRDALTLSLT